MNKKVFNEIESYMLECVKESAHDKSIFTEYLTTAYT